MTLNSRKVYSAAYTAISLIIVLSLVSNPLAQTRFARLLYLRQSAPQAPEQTEEEKKAAKELEKRALAFVDELATEAMSLKLVENRIYILVGAADALWKYDEERARALAREAMNQVVESAREASDKAAREDGQYFDPRYVRQRDDSYARGAVLNLLAKRDAKMALEILQALRSLRPAERRNPMEDYQDREMELHLAAQIVESDPQTALQIAEGYLDGKLNHQILNIWNALQNKNPNAASNLTDRIISYLKSQDVLSDYEALNLALNVSISLKGRIAGVANAQKNQTGSSATQINLDGMQRAYRDALEILVAAAIKITNDNLLNPQEADMARNLLAQIPSYLQDIEKLLPSRIAAVRARIAQFDKARYRNPHEKFYAEYGNDLGKKPVREMLDVAAKAPQEVREGVYQQAFHKAMQEGDFETARRIVKENISNKWQANEMVSQIERSDAERAISDGKYSEARRSLARMRTDEQRASGIAGWALAALNKGDRKLAREMLQEARALIGSRMQRNDQLEAQIAIANASVNLDPDASFEIAEAAIERLNRLVAANVEMQTFNGMDEGEMRIINGGVWDGHSGNIVQLLATLARRDFDRAVNLLKRWQSNEIRLMLSLSLAQNILSGHGVGYGGSVGGPVRLYRRGNH